MTDMQFDMDMIKAILSYIAIMLTIGIKAILNALRKLDK